MKFIFAFIAAFCMFQGLTAAGVKHRRDTTLSQTFDEIWTNAQSLYTNFTNAITANAPSSEDALKQMKSSADSMATKMQEMASQFTEQAHAATGDLSAALNHAAATINSTVTSIRANHPDAANQADNIKQNVQNMMQTVLAETKKVKDQLQGPVDSIKQTITTITENGLNDAKRLLEQAQQHLQEVNH